MTGNTPKELRYSEQILPSVPTFSNKRSKKITLSTAATKLWIFLLTIQSAYVSLVSLKNEEKKNRYNNMRVLKVSNSNKAF